MNTNKIHTYGCSFSFPYWMEENETYTAQLSSKIGCDYENKSFPALGHNECYHRLLSDLDIIQEGDLILYQFTTANREDYMVGDFYYSTAGLLDTLEETTMLMEREGGGRHLYPSDENLISIMDYTKYWSNQDIFYKFNRVEKILNFLKTIKKINYFYLFLDDSFDSVLFDNKTIKFENTYSIKDWIIKNKLTLGDIGKGFDEYDIHPNVHAHYKISEIIYNRL